MILLKKTGKAGKCIGRLSIASFFFIALSFPAFAQEISKKEDKSGKSISKVLEPATITANKHEENIQDVPMSITIINGMNIEDRQIADLNELGNFAPNLMIFSDGIGAINSPSMRGIHADAESLSVSTGLYIDEIPVSNTVGFADPLLDIERIEVLRGPQGTLYGKNTEVGAINIITRQPGNELRGSVTTKVGINTKSTGMNLSGPISKDRLFFGISGRYYEENGFVERKDTDDIVDDRENIYGKGPLRWTPANDLEVKLLISHLKLDDGASRMNRNPKNKLFFSCTPKWIWNSGTS